MDLCRSIRAVYRGDRSPKLLKVAAYNYAAGGGPKPDILKMAEALDRFGVEAVTGRRVLYYGEIKQIQFCEFILWAYRTRQASANWAEWVRENEQAAQLLNEAERLANG